jgi:hypothetical protein
MHLLRSRVLRTVKGGSQAVDYYLLTENFVDIRSIQEVKRHCPRIHFNPLGGATLDAIRNHLLQFRLKAVLSAGVIMGYVWVARQATPRQLRGRPLFLR